MKIVLLFFSLILLNSCGNSTDSEEKLDGTYSLLKIQEEDISSKGFTFTFDAAENRVSGKTGCNGFSAKFVQEENKVSISQAMSTKMYCEGKMELETKILSILPEVSKFENDHDQIIFSSAEGKNLFILKKE